MYGRFIAINILDIPDNAKILSPLRGYSIYLHLCYNLVIPSGFGTI